MDLKRLQELISSHEYKKDKGLMVRIDYSNCQEVFNDTLKWILNPLLNVWREEQAFALAILNISWDIISVKILRVFFTKDED